MSIPSDPNQSFSSPPPAAPEISPEAAQRIQWLAEEHAATDAKEERALWSFESAVLRERAHDEAGAAKDYLAAYNSYAQFREPVEALTALLERRKSFKNLSRLLEALVRAASTPEQLSRAEVERGAFLLEHQGDNAAAKVSFERAVEENADQSSAWYELELLGGKTEDAALRLRALEQRVRMAEPDEWRALLLIDFAKLIHQDGDFDRAMSLLEEASAIDSPARYRALCAREVCVRKEHRDDLLADVLEALGDLILLSLDDEAAADSAGLPLHVRSTVYVADLFLRASDAKRRTGDIASAVSLLDQALSKLPDEALLMNARMKVAEASGDTETSAALANRLLARGITGRPAAALHLRIFESAAGAGDREKALEALAGALAQDSGCVAARALQLDLLADGEASSFATSLESLASEGLSDEAKGRVYLRAAYAWALKARDVPGAKAALSQAAMFGVSHGAVARLGRAFASVLQDDVWFEETTRRLLAAGAVTGEHASLWWELGRLRLLRGDEEGASKAFESLAASPGGAWLGRVLSAYGLGLTKKSSEQSKNGRSAELIEQLAAAEADPVAARALRVLAAVRRMRSGDRAGALVVLRELHQSDMSDLLVGVMLADLERASGDAQACASTLAECAAATDDSDAAAALRLEAGFLLWREGKRQQALDLFEASRTQSAALAAAINLWAVASIDPNTTEGRRRVLELHDECGGDRIAAALDRFALEASSDDGDVDSAATALDSLERDAIGELSVAGWLGRMVFSQSASDARSGALDGLQTLGLMASAVVAAERYRIARVEEQDRAAARDHAQAWALADGGIPAALEWLAAGRAADDSDAEVSARRLIGRQLSDEASGALMASASLIDLIASSPTAHPPLLDATSNASRLMNLELSPSGCDPRRRASALLGLGDTLGEDCGVDALGLAGWSQIASGQAKAAQGTFRTVVQKRPTDIAAWEGLRAASESIGDLASVAEASSCLGDLCADDARAAAFHETAALLLLDKLGNEAKGEAALVASFARDATRAQSFDRLFRRIRSRKEDDKLLAVISRRLEVSENSSEIAKLFWEQARVLRQKGDFDAAMAALDNVVMLEPDHVGALALSGEVFIRRGNFAEAVDMLARLAIHPEAPAQQRLVSGMAAVDLCEHKLGDLARALQILLALHRSGLSNLPVRERLAKIAAQNAAWVEATSVLETLMQERQTADGRIEAARLAMAIYRDKLGDPASALHAVARLLDESPSDEEGLDLLLRNQNIGDQALRQRVLDRARKTITSALSITTLEPRRVELLARIASARQDNALRQAVLGSLVVLGKGSESISQELEALDSRVNPTPQAAIDDAAVAAISDARDTGPISAFFQIIAQTITEALGPTITGLGVTRKERVDPRDGLPIRNEIAHWAGALGISEFELYVGGRDPNGVVGVPGEVPILVVGAQITAPLKPHARQAIARELLGLRRGISIVRTRDDATVASIVVGVCNVMEVPIHAPQYATLAEVQRLMSKALPRKLKKVLPEHCQAIANSGVDPRAWVSFALSSLDRMAAIAAGDVSLVLSDALGVPRDQLHVNLQDNDRARRLVAFVLSDKYLELRSRLGMGVR